MLVSRRHPPRHHMGPGAVVGASVVRPPRHSRCGSGGPGPRASPQRGAEAPTAVAGGAAGASGAAPRAVLSPRALLTSQLTPRGFKPQNRAPSPSGVDVRRGLPGEVQCRPAGGPGGDRAACLLRLLASLLGPSPPSTFKASDGGQPFPGPLPVPSSMLGLLVAARASAGNPGPPPRSQDTRRLHGDIAWHVFTKD